MTGPERRAVGSTLSAHNQTHEDFLAILATAIRDSNLPARDLVLHAGAGIFPRLRRKTVLPVRHEHTRLPGVGVVDLALDPALEDWAVELRGREGA